MVGKAERLTDINFDQKVVQSDLPVLVDFWASWCPPCKMVEPILEELAVEYSGLLTIAKLHVDQNPRTRDRYQILGVPTFVLFRDGQDIARRTGAQSKGQLRQMLDLVL